MKDPLVKYSWLNVVGFKSNHSIGTVYDLLIKNNYVFEFLKGKEPTVAKDFLEVKAVKPCNNNPQLFRTLIKVSSAIRQVIKRGKDTLRIGLYSCRVYDQSSQVRRCNKCQLFGHWFSECSSQNGIACAKCASTEHETNQCLNPQEKKCINCIRSGTFDANFPHTADSTPCPCFIKYRESLLSNANSAGSNYNQRRPQAIQVRAQVDNLDLRQSQANVTSNPPMVLTGHQPFSETRQQPYDFVTMPNHAIPHNVGQLHSSQMQPLPNQYVNHTPGIGSMQPRFSQPQYQHPLNR